MARIPEGEPTHSRIFRNGENGVLQARGFGGVDPDNWKFNPDTQNYDYIGKPDENPQEIPVIKDIPQIR